MPTETEPGNRTYLFNNNVNWNNQGDGQPNYYFDQPEASGWTLIYNANVGQDNFPLWFLDPVNNITLKSADATARWVTQGRSQGIVVADAIAPREIVFGTLENPLNFGGVSAGSPNPHFQIGKNSSLVFNHTLRAGPGASGASNQRYLRKSGEGELVIRGVLDNPSTIFHHEGTLHIDFSANTATENIINTNPTLLLRNSLLKVSGRTDDLAVSESFANTRLTQGYGAVELVRSGTGGGDVTLNLGRLGTWTTNYDANAIVPNVQGNVDFRINEADEGLKITAVLFNTPWSGGATSLSANLFNGIIVSRPDDTSQRRPVGSTPLGTVNLTTWATADWLATTGNEEYDLYEIRGLRENEYTTAAGASNNVSHATDQVWTANTAANTLRLVDGASVRFEDGSGNLNHTLTLNLTSGGILVTGSDPDAGGIYGGRLVAHANQDNTSQTSTLISVFQNNEAGAFTLESNISAVSISKTGLGTLILKNTASTRTQATRIVAGVLQVEGIRGDLGTGDIHLQGGTLRYTGGGETAANRIFAQAGMAGRIEADGTGALKLTNTDPIANQSTVFSANNGAGWGTLELSGSNADDNEFHAFIGQTNNTTYNGLDLIKTGEGTWVLGNTTSNFRGATTIKGGTLKVKKLASYGQASSIGFGVDQVHESNAHYGYSLVIDGGRLEYIGTGDATDRMITLGASGATIAASGTGAITFNGGPVTVGGAIYRPIEFGMANEARHLTLAGSSAHDNIFGLQITDNGTGQTRLTKSEGGTWVITGDNTQTGETQVLDGILKLGGSSARFAGEGAALTIDGGTVDLGGYTEYTHSGQLTVNGTLRNGTFRNTGSLDVELQAGLVSANLTGAAGLRKTTGGEMTMTGDASFAGMVTVEAGKLTMSGNASFSDDIAVEGGMLILAPTFDGFFGSASVQSGGTLIVNREDFQGYASVAGGGTLGGSGSFYQGAEVASGGKIAPGPEGIGVIDFSPDDYSTLMLGTGSVLEIELNSGGSGNAGINWDQMRAGLVLLEGGDDFRMTLSLLSLDLSGAPGVIAGWDPAGDDLWESVISFSPSFSGSEEWAPFLLSHFVIESSGFLGATGEFFLSYNDDLSGINLNYLGIPVIPEPSTVMLLIGTLAGGALLRHRRRRVL